MNPLTLKTIAMFALLLTVSLTSQAESWQGITPLKSTRADVERLLGKPLPGDMSSLVVYRLEVGEVHIRYASSRLCREPDRCECLVPNDTVIEVSVESHVKAKFSSLNIDKRAFGRFPLVENTNVTIYRNASAGLAYAVSEKEDKILYVQYSSAEQDCQRALKKWRRQHRQYQDRGFAGRGRAYTDYTRT